MTGIKELAAALGVNGALTMLSLAANKLGVEGTKAICEALEQNKTLKELDISGHRNGMVSNIGESAGAKHVSKMLGVNGALTTLNLSSNFIGGHWDRSKQQEVSTPEGPKAIADALLVNGGLTNLDLSSNELCGLDRYGRGTYTAEGITAIADALRVNGALTRVDVRRNNIVGDGAVQLAAAVLGNLKIEMFNEIPIKEMRADSFTELDLKEKHVGVEGGLVVAGLIPVMGALTTIE
jgi:hypothetical protein